MLIISFYKHFAPAVLPEAAAELARYVETVALATTLQQELDFNLRDTKGNTPLIIAAYQRRAETVAMLLKAGAEGDLWNKKGQPPRRPDLQGLGDYRTDAARSRC